MTRPSQVPQPRELRTWLSWIARERWDDLAHFARHCGHVSDPSAAHDVIHDAMFKILAGEVRLPEDRKVAWCRLLATIRNVARNAGLDCLTPDQREVVGLRYLEEWTIAEVAERRGCSASAVKQLSANALAKLRAELVG